MSNQAFSKIALARMVYSHDFFNIHDLAITMPAFVEAAYQKALINRSAPLQISETQKKGKPVYKIRDFSDELIVRKITQNLKRITKAKQQNRDAIIGNLKRLLEESVSYTIYRLDISDFFGSINVEKLLAKIKEEKKLSRPTVHLTENILNSFQSAQAGLPRGIQLSATLAEYSLAAFDKRIQDHNEVYFYARFVDDMILITSGNENKDHFLHEIGNCLAEFGLRLNTKKQKQIKITGAQKRSARTLLGELSFLGYAFRIFHSGTRRDAPLSVEIDISPDKVRKIKTKTIMAFLNFIETRDFSMLSDRIKLLSGNFYVRDRKKLAKRTAGIFYSYRHANIQPDKTCAAYELDKFLRCIVLSNRGHIASQIASLLSPSQKKQLLKNSFVNGYKNKKFLHYSPIRLGNIMECWAHV